MQRTYLVSIAVVLFLTANGWSQESQTAQAKQILEDAGLVNVLIDQLVTNDTLRAKLLAKLAEFGKTDPARFVEMQKALAGEPKAAGAEILIKFKPGTKDEQIKAMAAKIGLQYVKSIPQLRVKVFRITSAKSVSEVINHCEKEAFVEYAEANQKYKIQK